MYELCPEPYFSNCSFSNVGCSSCKASNPDLELPLRYRAINQSLPRKEHPCSFFLQEEKRNRDKDRKIERALDIKKGRASRNSGYRNERRVASSLNAEFTEASGARYGDGDLIITAGPISFHMECKYRGDGRNESGPSKKELEKALGRGIDSFCTTSKTYPQGVVTLKYELFRELIELIRELCDGNS